MVSKTVVITTDGACLGNPGPGGWCAILRYGERHKVLSGGADATTNNQMEMTAAIASNCEPCFKHHFREALSHGVPRGDVALAVATARMVKEHIAEQVLKTAGEQLAAARDDGPKPGECRCK